LPVAVRERGQEADLAHALLDPVGGAAEAGGAEAPALHLVGGEHGHVAREARRPVGGGRIGGRGGQRERTDREGGGESPARGGRVSAVRSHP
jgi:hypothetical protein